MQKSVVVPDSNKPLKVSIKNSHYLLKKYKGFLSKKDLGNVLSLSLESPHKDLEQVTEEYLEKKYSVDKIETLLNSAKQDYYTYEDLMKKLGISRSRFYFRLNYFKRFVVGKKVGWVVKKGKISKRPHTRRDNRKVKGLLKHKYGERKILLNPGPVLTSLEVKNSLLQNDICHRDKDFEDLMVNLQNKSRKVFGATKDHQVLFISGSGTSGMEAALCSTIPSDKKVLILSNGAFGERFFEIAHLHKLNTVHIRKEWGEVFDLKEIESTLAQHPDIFAIVMNHSETSVGILNPVHEVGKLAKSHSKLFIVDAVSSLGGEELSVDKSHIDVCVSSANKCLHGFSGVSLVCVHKRVWDLIADVEPRSYYLDLKKYYSYSFQKNQTPFTPAVAVFYALEKALDELLEKGLSKRHLRYVELNSLLKFELSKMGFEFFSNHPTQSHTILTVKVPEGIDFDTFYREIKKSGFIIYPTKPPLAGKYFQIANMGELKRAMIYDFIFVVEKVLKKHRKQ